MSTANEKKPTRITMQQSQNASSVCMYLHTFNGELIHLVNLLCQCCHSITQRPQALYSPPIFCVAKNGNKKIEGSPLQNDN